MDDAMILPCGHSFGSGGMQQVYRMVRSPDLLLYCFSVLPSSQNFLRTGPNI